MNWGGSKRDNFVQNKYKLFLFFENLLRCQFFVSTMKLDSLTLGRLSKHLSNFHAIYFLSFFGQKMSCVCLKSEILCSIWCFCPNPSSPPWEFPRYHNTTLEAQEDVSKVLQFSLRKLQGSQCKQCWQSSPVLTRHPAEAWPPHPEDLSLLPSEYGQGGGDGRCEERTLFL